MSVTVTMPQLGESVTEGTVTRWLKAVGDTVVADEPLLEISTDKPASRRNSRSLLVTSVADSASAWQPIQRSLAPMGVPVVLRRVNCSA